MTTLYEKFLSENPTQICFSTFRKGRPFFCLSPKVNDREQCLCQTCCNLQHLSNALFYHSAVSTRDINMHLNTIVCSKSNLHCCLRDCQVCQEFVAYNLHGITSRTIRYMQWEKVINEQGFKVTRCSQKIDSSINVVSLFQKALEEYAIHQYTFTHQYREIRLVKDNLARGDLALHVDFSENYGSKVSMEVQAAHFGHHAQVVIHQGILYEAGGDPIAFATLSDDSRKNAAAVAAHINKVLEHFCTNRQQFGKLIVFSDSPSSQYRNMNTIFLIGILCQKYKFIDFEWIFTEKGHGKSSADGIGAAIKRKADSHVACGGSIQSSDDLVPILYDSKIFITKVRLWLSHYVKR
jgi:hypothetical protein